MLKIKRDTRQQDLQIVDLHFVNLNNFHSLEVVFRASETQLQVSGNLYYNTQRFSGRHLGASWSIWIFVITFKEIGPG